MATLQDIERKITAVRKTQQITKAMNMVTTSRLRKAQQRIENFRPYAEKFADVMSNLAARTESEIHPYLRQPEEVSRVELLVLSSDRGLCGSFNSNIIRATERFIREKTAEDVEVSLTLVGKKVGDYYKRRPVNIKTSYPSVMESFDYSVAAQIAQGVSDVYLDEEAQEVWCLYTKFINVGRQELTMVKLLPISPGQEEDELPDSGVGEYLYEPSVEAIMIDLLPRSFNIQVFNAMLETSASEHAARMMAMDNATNNCKDMIDDLTMVYNKARQTAITMELLDIVGGAEALKAS